MSIDRTAWREAMDAPTVFRCITGNPHLHPLLAEILAAYLRALEPGTSLGLYGYGSIAQALLASFPDALSHLRVCFVLTDPDGQVELGGLPVRAAADLVQEPPEHILVLSTRFEKEILARLSYLPPTCPIILKQVFEACSPEGLGLQVLSALISHVAVEAERMRREIPTGKPLVVFLTPHPPQHMVKTMREVVKLGYAVAVVVQSLQFTAQTSLRDYAGQGYFHSLYEAKQFDVALEFLELERQLQPALIHGEVSMGSTEPLACILEACSTPVVIEYRDFPETVFCTREDAMAAMQVDDETYAREELARRMVYLRADGLIMKDAPETLDFMANLYGQRPKAVLPFYHYFSEELAAPTQVRKLSEETGEFHIVYAGGVVNDPKWHNYPLYHSLLDAADVLEAQKIHLTIYNAGDGNGRGFEEYVERSAGSHYFHYHRGVPYAQLREILPRHDFGWFCFDFAKARENPFFMKITFGSKVFSYLEADLPVLISPEQAFMADMVTNTLGAGVAISFKDIGRLREILQSTDWALIRENIRQSRRDWTYAKHAHRLGAFYARLATADRDQP